MGQQDRCHAIGTQEKEDKVIGTQVLHYLIVEKLGEGGMGVVYKARDTKLDRFVALKFLPSRASANTETKARFLQEAKAAAALNHNNICTIYGVDESEGTMFIAMEYLDGGTLRDRIPYEKIDDTLNVAVQIGEALGEAHTRGIVHRDIKADNIMLTSKGQVKVMDFGLAKLKGSLKLTKSSSTVGTLAYMAPEQIQGGEVDHRSDIFSLGVLLFEMLTGKLPFRGEHEAAMMYSIVNEEPFPVEHFRSEVPSVLSHLIQRCLEKNPADRYQTAGDVVIELSRVRRQSSKVHRTGVLNTMPPSAVQSPQITVEPSSTHALPRASGNLKKFLWPAIGLVVAVIAFFVYNSIEPSPDGRHFQEMKITRLTNSGKVNQAAVSPDGKYVVYAHEDSGKQSLWVRQTATTSNVQVVPPSDAKYFRMLFSVDGNFVYVLKAEKEGELANLFSMPVLGGPMRKLIHNLNTFTLSPDGARIAFVRYTVGDATSELILANADGTGERPIGQRKAPQSYGAIAWAPDGSSITCSSEDVSGSSVVTVRVDDGSGSIFLEHEWSAISSMEWLRDGSGIVVIPQDLMMSAGAQIWEIDYPSRETRRITNDLNNYASISLTADSKSLVTTATEFHSSVWQVPAFGDERNGWNAELARQVTSGKDDGSIGVAQTPDGRILYTASGDGSPQIWTMDADHRNPRQLTNGEFPGMFPTASPDGKYVVYVCATRGSIDLWRIHPDGTNALQLTKGQDAFTPTFTPDSKWVVYSNVKDGKYALWKISIDGGEPVRLTEKHSHTAAVSPDGQFIACEYQENESGTSHQIAIFPMGSNAPVKTFDQQVSSQFAWLPGGRALGFTEDRNGVSNLRSFPLDGSPAEQLTDFKSDKIFSFSWSHDGKSLVVARGSVVSDVIMVSNFR
jgi:serine/threonine protein kinase